MKNLVVNIMKQLDKQSLLAEHKELVYYAFLGLIIISCLYTAYLLITTFKYKRRLFGVFYFFFLISSTFLLVYNMKYPNILTMFEQNKAEENKYEVDIRNLK